MIQAQEFLQLWEQHNVRPIYGSQVCIMSMNSTEQA
jgi:hypothetical protein